VGLAAGSRELFDSIVPTFAPMNTVIYFLVCWSFSISCFGKLCPVLFMHEASSAFDLDQLIVVIILDELVLILVLQDGVWFVKVCLQAIQRMAVLVDKYLFHFVLIVLGKALFQELQLVSMQLLALLSSDFLAVPVLVQLLLYNPTIRVLLPFFDVNDISVVFEFTRPRFDDQNVNKVCLIAYVIDVVLCLPLPVIRLLVVYLAPLLSLCHLVLHALLPLAALDAAPVFELLDPVVPSELFP
jgi:hypothetical protein